MASIATFIERKLKLKVNEQKSSVIKTSRCRFLGFTFHGSSLKWHARSLAKLKQNLRCLTGRSWGVSFSKRIHALNTYLRGWINYFGVAQGFQACVGLDHWIRRRLRMCLWKQWRRVRTRVKKLLELGVPLALAKQAGSSSKGYWRNSKTQAVHHALSMEFFSSMGLMSLRDRWVEIHYGDRTADCGPA